MSDWFDNPYGPIWCCCSWNLLEILCQKDTSFLVFCFQSSVAAGQQEQEVKTSFERIDSEADVNNFLSGISQNIATYEPKRHVFSAPLDPAAPANQAVIIYLFISHEEV